MAKKKKKKTISFVKDTDNYTVKNKVDEDTVIYMPAAFARDLIKSATSNVQKNSAKPSYTLYSKEDIYDWIQKPASEVNQKNLRKASNYMYLASMHYQRLLDYYASLYEGCYIVTPLNFNEEIIAGKENEFIKQYNKVKDSLDTMNLPQIMRDIFVIALREGAYYGVLVSDKDTAIVQQIPADYCVISAVCDGSFLYKVDMSKIGKSLEYYPSEFTRMYAEYIETGEKWQEVPVNISMCIKADSTLLDCTIPPFASVMPSLYTVANTESLQETAKELNNYKMIGGQIPLDSKGVPVMDQKTVEKYYAHIANALDENVGLALSPFKLETFNFDGKSNASEIDDVANAVSNFWATAGTSSLLHGQQNNTSGVTKLAIKNDESFMVGMIRQFERLINRYLKVGFTGKFKFKIHILPITCFNREEYLKQYKEASSFGIGKTLYSVALGVPQSDMAGMEYLETHTMPFDKLSPLKSSYTTGNTDNESGRPEDDDISDSGEQTRDNDSNSNR